MFPMISTPVFYTFKVSTRNERIIRGNVLGPLEATRLIDDRSAARQSVLSLFLIRTLAWTFNLKTSFLGETFDSSFYWNIHVSCPQL